MYFCCIRKIFQKDSASVSNIFFQYIWKLYSKNRLNLFFWRWKKQIFIKSTFEKWKNFETLTLVLEKWIFDDLGCQLSHWHHRFFVRLSVQGILFLNIRNWRSTTTFQCPSKIIYHSNVFVAKLQEKCWTDHLYYTTQWAEITKKAVFYYSSRF